MSRMSRGLTLAGAVLGASLFGAQAHAQDASGWHGSVTPYLWLAGYKGDVGAAVDSPPTPIDIEFPDVFDKLSGAFMGKAEIGYGAIGVLADVAYVKIAGDHTRQVGSQINLSGEVESALTEFTLAGYWRLYDDGVWNFDVLAGGRYTNTELEGDLTINSRQVSANRSLDWWDPVIGARATVALNDRWSLSGYADYGGFGVSSDMVTQIYGGVGWKFTDSIVGSLGYRYYKTEFTKGDFNYDLAIAGPLLGVTFNF